MKESIIFLSCNSIFYSINYFSSSSNFSYICSNFGLLNIIINSFAYTEKLENLSEINCKNSIIY